MRVSALKAVEEWTADMAQQEVGGDETPWLSRSPSAPAPASLQPASQPPLDYFPFTSPRPSVERVMEQLPPYEEARSLVDSYYRYYAWK